jgi:hypothetical protein
MDICSDCSGIDWKGMLDYDGDDPPRHKLTGASDSQCAICCMLCSIRRYLQSRTSEYSTIASDDNPELGPTELECYEHWLDQLGVNHGTSIRTLKLYMEETINRDDLQRFFWTFPDMQQSRNPQIRKKSGEEVKLGKVDYDLIRAWISICESEHTSSCSPAVVKQTNVVELFVIDVATRSIIKAPTGSHYIALSYVCGKPLPNLQGLSAESWRLDLENSHALLPDNIPRTIEDAMDVVRKLNHRYLWVDAYCISQFDSAQREYFIGRMDEIYEGAVLTIIAMSGIDSEAGLAGVSTPLTGWPQTTVETTNGTLMVTEVQSVRSVFRDSKWYTRAWTLQEGTLSRRCLCFARNTYFMWCREELFSEVARVDSNPDRFKWSLTTANRPYCFGLDFNDNEFTMVEFQNMLQAYTARQFTRSSDALNAAIGMMNRISRLHGVKFSYGMPTKPDLVYCLLWTAEQSAWLRRRPGFPSWSWLGWEGKVECTSYRVNPPDGAETSEKGTRASRAPGVFCPGRLGVGIAGQWREDFLAWQADSTAHIEYPIELEKSQELRVTTARAVFPLVMLAHDGESLPNGKAVGDFWTMVGNDGESIAKRQDCFNLFRWDSASAFRVAPEVSSELDKVSSAAEFLLMHHWIEVHEDGRLKEPYEWKKYGTLGDVVLAILIIRNSDNTAWRAATLTIDYRYWIQGNPQTVEVVLV